MLIAYFLLNISHQAHCLLWQGNGSLFFPAFLHFGMKFLKENGWTLAISVFPRLPTFNMQYINQFWAMFFSQIWLQILVMSEHIVHVIRVRQYCRNIERRRRSDRKIRVTSAKSGITSGVERSSSHEWCQIWHEWPVFSDPNNFEVQYLHYYIVDENHATT